MYQPKVTLEIQDIKVAVKVNLIESNGALLRELETCIPKSQLCDLASKYQIYIPKQIFIILCG
jgi:hypothetical protein